MTRKSVFSFSDYKTYLRYLEEVKFLKGFRTRIAEASNCQNAFVSQVLNGDVNFKLEQALKISSFLKLNADEQQFFLWMVEFKRAGTTELKKYFSQLMDSLRQKNLQVKDRANAPQILSAEAQTKYYSSWLYSSLHIGVMIPTLDTVSSLARALNVSEKRVEDAVNFLIENNLVERHGNRLKSGRAQIHLENDSPDIHKLHTNWRVEAIKSLDSKKKNDLHYSGVSSLSRSDAVKIRAMFLDVLEGYFRTVEKSPEETLYVVNLDFFTLINNDD